LRYGEQPDCRSGTTCNRELLCNSSHGRQAVLFSTSGAVEKTLVAANEKEKLIELLGLKHSGRSAFSLREVIE
jgi:hypothetical protein